MPGMRCAVAVCENSYFKTKNRLDVVSYFRFPSENDKRRKIWIEKCKRKDVFNPNTSYICSEHFNEADFKRNFQSEIMGCRKKKVLKKCAIPSQKLMPHEVCKESKDDSRKDRSLKKKQKEMVSKLLNDDDSVNIVNSSDFETKVTVENVEVNYQLEYAKLKEEFENYKQQKEEQLKEVEQECKLLKKEKETAVEEEIRAILSGIFSPAQIDILTNKKKKVKEWSSEDITKAFTIRYLSKRCYIHLRKTMGIPLPCLSTLKEWASRIQFHSGVLTKVIKLIECAAVKMKSFEKLVVLQFDEMKILSVYEYDASTDKVLGPHSQVQVIMIRSLCASWKQPVFVDFDFKMTKDCIDEIILRLNSIGIIVVAIVSDCGGGNIGLWKTYKVSYESSSIISEITKRKIYFFADVPHLIKLIRNWFLDGGFQLKDSSIISPEPVKMLVEKNKCNEISSIYKLTPEHINCEKFQRQNVRLAVQLLSNTTACALKRYNVCDESLRRATANFIKSTNDWFDVMNSTFPNASMNLQCGYGVHIDQQKNALETYSKLVEEMICLKKTEKKKKTSGKVCKTTSPSKRNAGESKNSPLKLFQKGVIMSTKSLMALYDDLKTSYKVSYILTSKLNQDSLENFFSLVRGSGGCNDHPTPLECLYRMRLIVLGKSDSLRVNSNTRQTDDESLAKF